MLAGISHTRTYKYANSQLHVNGKYISCSYKHTETTLRFRLTCNCCYRPYDCKPFLEKDYSRHPKCQPITHSAHTALLLTFEQLHACI